MVGITELDKQFAIVQKANQIKLNELKKEISNSSNTKLKFAEEIDSLLKKDKIIYNDDLKELDLILETKNDVEFKRTKIKTSDSEKESWEKSVLESVVFLKNHNIDVSKLNTYSLLSAKELKKINDDFIKPFEELKWDIWDYGFVTLAGIIGIATDFLIVKIPKTIKSGVYKGQEGSKLTENLNNIKLPKNWQKSLSEFAKVPYDNSGGADHRIDTIGHDPVLGLIFGTIDIFRGSATTMKKGVLEINRVSEPANLIIALLKQLAHLLSDVTTSKGIPVPFSSLIRLCNFGEFHGPTGKKRTLSDLALWMYHNGYDLRHFVTMSITPATIEIILRAYIMIRHYFEKDELKFKIANSPKYRSMLLVAHAIACAGNAGKIYFYGGNPLALNYAEWIALVRYLIPSIKYWLKDKHINKLNHYLELNRKGWDNLVFEKNDTFENKYFDKLDVVVLGQTK